MNGKMIGALALALGLSFGAQSQTLTYARLSNNLASRAISADASNNSYALAGSFIEKRNSGGTLVWSKEVLMSFGGQITDISADRLGNIYFTGFYNSDVHSPGGGPCTMSFNGNAESISLPFTVVPSINLIGQKLFLAKASSAGILQWVKTFSTQTDQTQGQAVTTDANNNVYLVGRGSSNMNFGAGNILTTWALFVLKLNSAGNHVYSKALVNSGYNLLDGYDNNLTINDIAVNNAQELVVTGDFNGTAVFNPSLPSTSLTSSGSSDVFVARYNASGVFQWVKKIGGTGTDVRCGVMLDNSGNLYSYGLFSGTVDFNPDPLTTVNKTSAGGLDMFIVSLNSTGAYRWASTIGGTSNELPFSMAQTDFDLYASGGFTGTVDFNASTSTTNNLTSAGGQDIFMLYMNNGNGAYTTAYRSGSTGNDKVNDVCSLPSATLGLVQTGTFTGTVDFNPSATVTNLTATGSAAVCILGTSIDIVSGRVANPNSGISQQSALISTVYPNPVHDQLQVVLNDEATSCAVTIFSIDGRLVYSTTNNETKQLTIDLSDLSTGIYFVRVESNGQVEQQKIIKH